MINFITKTIKRILQIRNAVKLRTKLLLSYLIIIVFSYAITGYLTTQRIGIDMMEQSTRNEEKDVLQLKENVKNLLNMYIYLSNDIIFNDKISKYFWTVKYYPGDMEKIFYEEIEPTFVKYRNLRPEISKITIYTKNDKIPVNGDEITFLEPESFESTVYDAVVKLKGKALWLCQKNNEGKSFITLNRLHYVNSKETGMVSIFINQNYMSNFIKEHTDDSSIYIIDPNGTVVSSTKNEIIGKEIMDGEFVNLIGNGELTVKDLRINGEKLQTICTSFSIGKDSPSEWKIIKTRPYKMILQKINLEKKRQIFTFFIISLFAALFAYLIARSLGNNIKKLVRGMKKLQNGDFSVTVDLDRNDEIGYLGNSFNTMVKKLNELISEVYKMKMLKMEMEVKKKEAENYALQSQINPHFLFNTLDTIIYGITEGKPETAHIVKLLAKSFRRTLQWEKDTVTIEDEINFIKEYLVIQKFRFQEKLNWNIDIPENLLLIKIPKLILQPMVENSIHHGISMKKEGGTLSINARLENEKIIIIIEDDGVGIEEDKIVKIIETINTPSMNTSGINIGIKNVYDRVKQHFGDNGELKLSSIVNYGTRIELVLPLIV